MLFIACFVLGIIAIPINIAAIITKHYFNIIPLVLILPGFVQSAIKMHKKYGIWL